MTRDELFVEVRQLEGKAVALMHDETKQGLFEATIQRVEDLTSIAKQEGWL